MIIPEINPEHLDIIPVQQKNRAWTKGFIVTKPNCSLQSYVPLLHAWKEFNPIKVIVSTYQAISGAGKTLKLGRKWWTMLFLISGGRKKSEKEPQKILEK